MGVSVTVLCTTAIRVVSNDVNNFELLTMVLYLLAMIFQIFMYCFVGNTIIYVVMNNDHIPWKVLFLEISSILV
jgi:7tm Odorant receptor